jgi:hypothetical protein
MFGYYPLDRARPLTRGVRRLRDAGSTSAAERVNRAGLLAMLRPKRATGVGDDGFSCDRVGRYGLSTS